MGVDVVIVARLRWAKLLFPEWKAGTGGEMKSKTTSKVNDAMRCMSLYSDETVCQEGVSGNTRKMLKCKEHTSKVVPDLIGMS